MDQDQNLYLSKVAAMLCALAEVQLIKSDTEVVQSCDGLQSNNGRHTLIISERSRVHNPVQSALHFERVSILTVQPSPKVGVSCDLGRKREYV